MTIERALELLPQMRDSEWITALGQKTALYTDEAKEAFNMAISALEKQEKDRWIPVKESEPTETELYLVTEHTVVERKWTTRMRIAKCEVSKLYDGRVDVCWRGYGGRVLAWRTLPEAYTEEES